MSRLRAEALGKSYRSRQVVEDLSLEVASGEVVGLLGPNGAGKTTAFYMIVGLVPCDEGRIYLDDQELTRLPMYRRAQLGVGYLPQEASVFRKLSVEDNILRDPRDARRPRRRRGAAARAGVAARGAAHRPHPREQRHEPVGRRAPARRDRARAGRRAALHPARRTVRRRRSDLGASTSSASSATSVARNIGVLITDHNVRETLGICSRAYIVSAGSVIASGSAEEILANPQVREVYLGQDFRL